MDFKRTGIPNFTLNDSLGNFVIFSRGMTLPQDSRYGAFEGDVQQDGQTYRLRADQNYTANEAAYMEVLEVFDGDSFEGIELLSSTPESFAAKLAKIGSTPVIASDGSRIWWIDERMSFTIKNGVPSTICWWQDTLKDYNEEIENIFTTGQVP